MCTLTAKVLPPQLRFRKALNNMFSNQFVGQYLSFFGCEDVNTLNIIAHIVHFTSHCQLQANKQHE